MNPEREKQREQAAFVGLVLVGALGLGLLAGSLVAAVEAWGLPWQWVGGGL